MTLRILRQWWLRLNLWADFRGKGTLKIRAYANHAEYLEHQKSKLDTRRGWIENVSPRREEKMVRNFRPIVESLSLNYGTVLCLGARLGEEVRAFQRCGLIAVGVDINPGRHGIIRADFHDLPKDFGLFDGAYCNSLDHVYDLPRFMNEIRRVIRQNGWVYFELSGGYEETGRIDPYGAMLWKRNADLVDALEPYIDKRLLDKVEGTKRTLVFRVKGI